MMGWFSLLIVTLTILSLSANPAFVQALDRNYRAEAGDADQLSQQMPSNISIVSLTDPFNFSSSTSISSQFNFTIGNGVALVIIPADFPSKFGTNMSFEVLDTHQFLGVKFYANVCKISSSSGVTNVSNISNVLKDGVNLSSWIEYQPTSKRLEVSLAKLGDPKPAEPIVSVRIDLVEILKGEEVMLGLASYNKEHEQITSWGAFGDYSHERSTEQYPNKEVGTVLIIIWVVVLLLCSNH